jgi:formate hydrogenlyase transcriptional activator
MRVLEINTNLSRLGPAVIHDPTPHGASVEELLAFERMLADLSARFANVPVEQVEFEVQVAQTILRQFLGFDRATFAEFQKDGSLVVLSSTAVEGFESTPLGQLPEQLTWFLGQLRAGKIVVTPNAAVDLPPEAAAEAEYCRRTGLVSHLAIPLRIGGRIIGAIAFSASRENRTWPDDLTTRLKLVGEVFAQAIARKREQETLLAALAEIKALKDRLERENSYLQHVAQIRPPLGLISRSPCFLSVIEEIARRLRKPAPRFCCWAKPEAARKSSRRRFTMRALEKLAR